MEVEEEAKRRRKMETRIVEKVGRVIAAVNAAKHVDEVVYALHSLAILLFPVDSRALSDSIMAMHDGISGAIDERFRDELLSVEVPSEPQKRNWWQVFYGGAAFPALARLLLHDIASSWLACFPISAQKHVYDVFFVNGRVSEVVQAVVPCLQQSGEDSIDTTAVSSNVERLLVLCLIENDGICEMAREFAASCRYEGLSNEQLKIDISRKAQLVTSIPDKARLGAPASLSSHLFFKRITIALLAGAEEMDRKSCDEDAVNDKSNMDGAIIFVGEVFGRICRRGSADVLLSAIIPEILKHVKSFMLQSTSLTVGEAFESSPGFRFWLKMMETIKDPYAVERISEQMLHQLAAQNASDVEAYWILWILVHKIYVQHISIRSMFVEKFLIWKVFPVCCLRWILQFAVFECPPDTDLQTKIRLSDAVQRLSSVWSKREFVQSSSIEQQAYVTAALGISLEKMSKEDLDATKDAMHSILQGVSCRLESPTHLVRKMASSIAFVFSKIIDPKNPLYLDDSCSEGTVDWEFGLVTPTRGTMVKPHGTNEEGKGYSPVVSGKETDENGGGGGMSTDVKGRKKKVSELKLVDPDEVIDPAMLNNEWVSNDEDDDTSENSDASSDASLQPYDLTDDDTDLKRNFSQLVDVVGALRKSDDADGVERALDVAEKLVRASPEELKYVVSDLVRILVQVRCSDLAVEGEEDSAEEKREKALVASIVMCPFESLDTLNKLLYSPNVDVSQRIMILDVLTDAAQELADATTLKLKHPPKALITTSDANPWFMPRGTGPTGAGPWKEITGSGTSFNWAYSYERELPPKPGQIRRGKTRRWGSGSARVQENHLEWSQNKFPQYAAAFMLPAMQGFDKKRHGVDLLGKDFIVVGKLIYMLGICMKCAAMHPEASALALPLLDMLSSRELSHHPEAYVRRAVLFAASCILVSLNPSSVASALVEGNHELTKGLDWVRIWALHVAESDIDRDCYTMAMTCLQLHSEMGLQASRALESAENTPQIKSGIGLPSNLSKATIKIPYLSG